MSHPPPPPPPPRQPSPPLDGKYIVDSFISYIEQLRVLAKKDPKRFKEMCEYMDAEISRFGELYAKNRLKPSSEGCQEVLNLNRRLSITYLLMSYLKSSR